MNKVIIINVDDIICNNYGNESILRENVDVLIEQLKEAKENSIDIYFYTDITNPDCKSLFSLRPELKNIVDDIFVHEDYLNPKPVIDINYDKIFYVDNSHRELEMQIDDFINKNPEKEIIYYDLEESFGRPSSLRKLMEVKLEDEKDINFVKNYFEIIKSDPTLPILADKINEFTYDDDFNPGLDIVSRTLSSNLSYYEERLGDDSNVHISYFEGNDLERMSNFISEAFDSSWSINAEIVIGKEQIQWDVEKECYLFESRESVIDGLDRIHPEFFDKENEKSNEKDNSGFDLTD